MGNGALAAAGLTRLHEVGHWRWRVSRQHGSTLFELVTILAIGAVLCVIAMPGVAAVRSVFAADAAAERLALVLRDAQARAQAHGAAVRVSVAGDGGYSVRDVLPSGDRPVLRGELGADVTSNYPQGTLEFGAAGWPALPGDASPRAGHFSIGTATAGHVVVVQLGGCVRCT
jgi:Tfp pilus assembly protein FimT